MLADLRREPRTERIALAGLDAAAAARLIGGWVGDEAGPGLAPRLRAETEGNPFFIEEVLRDLVEDGALVREGGRWRADGPLAVPESVREVIGRRVERLSDDAVAVLELAAVDGRDFDLQVLAGSGVLARDVVLDGLRRPSARSSSGRRGAGRWSFSHALVREALYDELSSLRRTRLHAAVADALVRAGAPARGGGAPRVRGRGARGRRGGRSRSAARPRPRRSPGSTTRRPPPTSPAHCRRSSWTRPRTRSSARTSCSRAATRSPAPRTRRPRRRSRPRASSRAPPGTPSGSAGPRSAPAASA